jgi:hypothetical protein
MAGDTPKHKRSRNPLQQMLNGYRERRARERRQARRVLFIVLGAFLVAGILIMIVNAILTTAETWRLRAAYGAQLAGMCNPPLGGTPDAVNMPTSDGPPGLVVLKTDTGTRHAWHRSISGDGDRPSVVACINERWTELETCSVFREMAKGADYDAEVIRRQHTADVILLNAATGGRIAETELLGPEPRACPTDYSELVGEDKQFIDGERLQPNAFVVWYEGAF